MSKIEVSHFHNSKKNSEYIASQMVRQIFQDMSRKIIQNNCGNFRQRSGSEPSQKKSKQSDLQSISTMAGTFPSHNSDKRIDQIQSKRVQIKVPDSKKDPENMDFGKQVPWSLDRNGYMISSSQDMTNIKYYFIKVASKFGMVVMRDLQDLITVRSQRMESIKCLFLMCLPVMSDRSVYQLQRYKTNKGSKIKLRLISGFQGRFFEFTKSFYYELWNKNVLNLTNYQALNLMCFANKKIISESIISYEQACSQFQIKNLGTQQQIQGWQTQLMRKFKRSQQTMKQTIYNLNANNNRICKNSINEIMIQRIIMQEIPICDFYLKMEMDVNREFLQKKKKILQTYSIKQIFQYLQIDKKLLKQQYYENKKPICEILNENLPFSQASYFLDELNMTLSPIENIGKITNFGDKLLECFQIESGKSDSVMDMDCQLPLTIYCSLICKNSQLKPTISFLCDYFEPQDEYETQNRTLAALKAALEYTRQEWKLMEQEI